MTDVHEYALGDERVLVAADGDVIAVPDDDRPAYDDPGGDDEFDREMP